MSSDKPPITDKFLQAIEQASKSQEDEDYIPLPPAPPYEQFYQSFMAVLLVLLEKFYLSHMNENDISLSICVLDRKPTEPMNILIVPGILSHAEQTLNKIVWREATFDQDTRDGIIEMMNDLADISERLNLEMTLRYTNQKRFFFFECSKPDDMIRLLEALFTYEGVNTLDALEGVTLLGPNQTISGQAKRHFDRMFQNCEGGQRKTIDHPFLDDDFSIDYIPQGQYVSEQHAFVSLTRAGRRGILPVSLALLKNILKQERGQGIYSGQGLVRLQ